MTVTWVSCQHVPEHASVLFNKRSGIGRRREQSASSKTWSQISAMEEIKNHIFWSDLTFLLSDAHNTVTQICSAHDPAPVQADHFLGGCTGGVRKREVEGRVIHSDNLLFSFFAENQV